MLKLDPRWPVVWRSPFSVQLGIDPPLVVLDDLSDTDERMLSALTVGVSLPGLTMICHGRAADRDWLLERLRPALLVESTPAALPLVAVTGTGSLVGEVARVLAGSGVRVVVADSADDLVDRSPDLAVLVGHFVLAPAMHSMWLRRDIPHIPVVASDTGVVIGPIIEPGDGPCLLCIELHRRDADAAWPAVATQLLGRRSPVESALVSAEAAATLARLALARLGREGLGGGALGGGRAGESGSAVSVRIDAATGERTTREWPAHPECGCGGIAHLVSAGAATPATSRQPESGSPVAGRSAPVPG